MQRYAAFSAICCSAQAKAFCDVDAPARFSTVLQVLGRWNSVDDNVFSAGRVCAAIDKNMAHANPAGNHRNGGLLAARIYASLHAAALVSISILLIPYAAFSLTSSERSGLSNRLNRRFR